MKLQKKAYSALALAMTTVMFIAGCGAPSANETPSSSSGSTTSTEEPSNAAVNYDTKYNISIASGASGGGYYMVGSALSKVIQEHDPNLSCTSESTGGTSENISLISSEESTIGMGMADDIVSAYNGERDYEGMPADNLRAICAGQTNTFQIIVLASSDIHSLSDLKGKTISLGPSGAPYFGPDLLKSTCGYEKDKDYNGQYLAHDQAADALSDGNVDCVIATLAYPASAYSNLSFTKDVRFISLTDEEQEKAMNDHSTWVKSTIPAGTYNKQDEDVKTLAIPVWLFTYADMDEDAIYRVTKAIYENVPELGSIYTDAGKYDLNTALEGVSIPIHPGAQKYFNEVKGK